MNFILFQHDIDNNWTRSDFSFEEACYSNEEIISSLESVGFKDIQSHGTNRTFFICQNKKLNHNDSVFLSIFTIAVVSLFSLYTRGILLSNIHVTS